MLAGAFSRPNGTTKRATRLGGDDARLRVQPDARGGDRVQVDEQGGRVPPQGAGGRLSWRGGGSLARSSGPWPRLPCAISVPDIDLVRASALASHARQRCIRASFALGFNHVKSYSSIFHGLCGKRSCCRCSGAVASAQAPSTLKVEITSRQHLEFRFASAPLPPRRSRARPSRVQL